jgi:hypothetical protein
VVSNAVKDSSCKYWAGRDGIALLYASKRLRKDNYIKWLAKSKDVRRAYARKRLIQGVLEERRVRQKYHPNGPWFKKIVENDDDLN